MPSLSLVSIMDVTDHVITANTFQEVNCHLNTLENLMTVTGVSNCKEPLGP